jgi:uncharacterized protein (DUF58 family)
MIPADRGGRQLNKLLEALALLRAEGTLPLRGLVEAEAQLLPRGSTVVIITHSVEDDVALSADMITRRGLRPVLVLIDASSFNGPTGTDQPRHVEFLVTDTWSDWGMISGSPLRPGFNHFEYSIIFRLPIRTSVSLL